MNNVPCVAYSETHAFIAGFGVCLICVAPFIVFLCRALDSKIRALKKEKAWSASLELYISSLRTCLDDRASEIVVLTTAGLTAAIKAAQFDEQRAALRIRLVDLADRLQRVVEASWTLRRFQTLVELAASVKRLATGVSHRLFGLPSHASSLEEG